MRRMHPSDYYYPRYRITEPTTMPPTTVSLPHLEQMALVRKVGAARLRAIVKAEAGRLRASGDYTGTLSAAVLRAVRSALA